MIVATYDPVAVLVDMLLSYGYGIDRETAVEYLESCQGDEWQAFIEYIDCNGDARSEALTNWERNQ